MRRKVLMVLFGDCLLQLIEKYGWKRSQFVRAMAERGIHPSQVRRWLRSERTPRLDTNYPDQMAQLLGLTRKDQEMLREAQVESLRGLKEPPSPRYRARQQLHDLPPAAEPAPEELPGPATEGQFVPFGSFTGAFFSRAGLLAAARRAIESAPAHPSDDRDLLLTHQSKEPFLDSSSQRQWITLLRSVLQRGYDIVLLVQLSSGGSRSLLLARLTLNLLGTAGTFHPRYFVEHGMKTRPYELVIVPGVGALVGFAAKRSDEVDVGLAVTDPMQIRVLRAHYDGLRADTRPLVEVYAGDGGLIGMFAEVVVRVGERAGDDFSFMPGLSHYTVPYSRYREDSIWARSVRARGLDVGEMIRLGKSHLNNFFKGVQEHRYLQICPRSYVLDFVREGRNIPFSEYGHVAAEDRLEQLENTIALLDTFDNYELALPTDPTETDELPANFWRVKWALSGQHTVLVEASHGSRAVAGERVGIEITEPTACRAFNDYYLDIWDNCISPVNKDKREVRAFLQTQADWLRRQIGLPG